MRRATWSPDEHRREVPATLKIKNGNFTKMWTNYFLIWKGVREESSLKFNHSYNTIAGSPCHSWHGHICTAAHHSARATRRNATRRSAGPCVVAQRHHSSYATAQSPTMLGGSTRVTRGCWMACVFAEEPLFSVSQVQ